jgi:RNA polymerase sigma factor (sigma-70 family)
MYFGMMAASVRAPAANERSTGLTFTACYEAHRDSVYHLGLRYGGGDRSFAEDLTHDVFVRLLEHLPELNETHDLGGWLYRVAANLALSRRRRARSIVRRFLPDYGRLVAGEEPAPQLLFEQREAAALAVTALGALPARERVVLCMKVLDGKSQREIAGLLSLTEGYVSKVYARAWARLRAAGWESDDEGT